MEHKKKCKKVFYSCSFFFILAIFIFIARDQLGGRKLVWGDRVLPLPVSADLSITS
jgi:hypothetical protein